MVLDTNILIAYLNGEGKVIKMLSEWKSSGRALFISTISKAEVLSLPQLLPKDIEKIRFFLNNFFSVPFDDSIAEKAAFIRRIYKLKLPDAGIAATALAYNLPLVTRDCQFKKIKEIIVIEI
jgi:hypothetical protein